MNSLSWFIYLAGVFGTVGIVSQTIAVLGGMAAVALTLLGTFIHSDPWAGDKDKIEKAKKFWEEKRKMCARAAYRVWCLWAIALVVLIFTPDKRTMYAIAASEVGEKIVKSEAVQGVASDAQRALQAWIKNQIEPQEKGKKPHE